MTDTIAAETPIKRVGPQHTDGKRPEVDAAVEKLDAAIDRFINDPSAFKLFLQYKGAMHNYSWNNLILILMDAWRREQEDAVSDNPDDLTRWHKGIVTMGYQGWRKQGRNVRKGAKAIPLFKPIIITIPPDKSESGKKETKCIGFEIIHKTFHIQDTDGPDYETPTPKPMQDTDETIESSRNLCKWLCRVALDDLGVSAIYRDKSHDRMLGASNGAFVTDAKKLKTLKDNSIMVKSTLSMAQAAKTLAHEMAHCVAEHGKVTNYHTDAQARSACESIAEGAAFVVMSHYGYDTTDYTVPYIAAWAKDTNVVKQVIKDISEVAATIITKVDARMNPPKEA